MVSVESLQVSVDGGFHAVLKWMETHSCLDDQLI